MGSIVNRSHKTSEVAETSELVVVERVTASGEGERRFEERDIPLSIANLNDRRFTSETF